MNYAFFCEQFNTITQYYAVDNGAQYYILHIFSIDMRGT